MVKQVPGEEFETNNRMVAATKLQEGDEVLSVALVEEQTATVVLQTTGGYFLRFPLEDISVLKKASRGVRGIKLSKNEELEQLYLLGDEPYAITYKDREINLSGMRITKRDAKGTKR